MMDFSWQYFPLHWIAARVRVWGLCCCSKKGLTNSSFWTNRHSRRPRSLPVVLLSIANIAGWFVIIRLSFFTKTVGIPKRQLFSLIIEEKHCGSSTEKQKCLKVPCGVSLLRKKGHDYIEWKFLKCTVFSASRSNVQQTPVMSLVQLSTAWNTTDD